MSITWVHRKWVNHQSSKEQGSKWSNYPQLEEEWRQN